MWRRYTGLGLVLECHVGGKPARLNALPAGGGGAAEALADLLSDLHGYGGLSPLPKTRDHS